MRHPGDDVGIVGITGRRILVAAGEPALRETAVRLLALDGYEAVGSGSAEETLAWLETERFSLALCDLRLTGPRGEPLARVVRAGWPQTGLVLLMGPEDSASAAACVADGDDCLLRQRCREDLGIAVRRALEKRRLAAENEELRHALEREMRGHADDLGRSLRRAGRAYRLALESLVAALDAREGETQRHSGRVAEYSMRLAQVIGLTEREKRKIFHGALLHDVGKIGIPDSVLLKPAPLTPEEWRIMRSHPRVGFGIVRDLPFLRTAAECIVGHHERYDGLGYPLGLRGDRLPMAARIVAVADALDAMSVRRPYRRSLAFERIHEELVTNRGTQFDPEVTDAALAIFHSYDDLHQDARESLLASAQDLTILIEAEPNRSSRLAA